MLKQISHKTGSIALAFIVLFSSFSFTVHEHICGGKVADTSFFLEADSCGMDMDTCANTTILEQGVQQEPCCDDHREIIQGNDTNQQAQQSLKITQVQLITAFVVSYISTFQKVNSTFSFVPYKPPSVYKNIQTLFQVFRI